LNQFSNPQPIAVFLSYAILPTALLGFMHPRFQFLRKERKIGGLRVKRPTSAGGRAAVTSETSFMGSSSTPPSEVPSIFYAEFISNMFLRIYFVFNELPENFFRH
jgi:hypothetical protein